MDKEIYNSIFQEEIHDLIALKRALGFSYRAEAGSLRRIDTFLCENNLSEKRISKELCDLWCRKRTYETVTNQASRISVMRVFCRYLNDIGIPAYIPPKGITRKRSRYDAHIYTDEELQSFFDAVDKSQSVPDSCPYRADVMPVFSVSCTPVGCVFRSCALPESVILTSEKGISLFTRPKIIKSGMSRSILYLWISVRN